MDADRQQAIRERHKTATAGAAFSFERDASLADIPDLLAALADAEATIGRVEAELVRWESFEPGSEHWHAAAFMRAALDGGRRDGDETGEAGL